MKRIIFIFLAICFGAKAQSGIGFIKVHLTDVQIRNMNSSPVDVGLPFPGTNKAYEVISLSVEYNYGTVPFDGADYVAVLTFPLNMAQARTNIILDQSNSNYVKGNILSLINSQLQNNQKLFIATGSDSNFGDGNIDVYITYRTVSDNENIAPPILDTIITLTSPQLLNIFTTPVTLIPSAGTNNTIEVVSITDKLIFNTTAYTGHQTLIVKTATATDQQANGTVLNQSANCKHLMVATSPVGLTQLLPNQPLIATTTSANPSTGDSSIELHIYYRIIPY